MGKCDLLNVQRSTSNAQRPMADGAILYCLSQIWGFLFIKTIRPSAPCRRLGRGTKLRQRPHPYKNTKFAVTKNPRPLLHPIKMPQSAIRCWTLDVGCSTFNLRSAITALLATPVVNRTPLFIFHIHYSITTTKGS